MFQKRGFSGIEDVSEDRMFQNMECGRVPDFPEKIGCSRVLAVSEEVYNCIYYT